MKIQITASSNLFIYNIQVDTQTNFFTLNGMQKSIDTLAFKEKLFDIIFDWDKNMIVPYITDAQEYKITISDNNQKTTLVGKGKYPENYDEFISLLKEVESNE